MLPPCQHEPSLFHTPHGWTAEPIKEEGRKTRLRYVQRDPESGEEVRSFDRRVDLEDALEREYRASGSEWLGQFVEGVWEIRSRSVLPALSSVVTGLVATGAVTAVPPAKSGRGHVVYLAANRYFAGEAFPRAPSQLSGAKRKHDEEEAEPEEEMADIELERLRNIERNKEILRSLGLA